jgi:hypothetical protein
MSSDNIQENDPGEELSDDNRASGHMRLWVEAALNKYGPSTTAALHARLLKRVERPDDYWFQDRGGANRSRSLRNSMTRAMRCLAKAGKISCNEVGEWSAGGRLTDRRSTAYHEAGHAVIGMALQLPVAFACVTLDDRNKYGYVAEEVFASSVGYLYKKNGRLDTRSKAAIHDAFGNPMRKKERTPEEHHAEVVMCIAAPWADSKLSGGNIDWKSKASASDMRNARHHPSKLGDAAKSWEEYERDTEKLVNKYWPMIEAVADRLMKVDFVSGYEIDSICQRVVRRQHRSGK